MEFAMIAITTHFILKINAFQIVQKFLELMILKKHV